MDADLTATAGSWAPEPVSLGYQWYRKAKSGKVTKITGATSAVYHVKPSDLGYRIRAKVTGTKTGYTSTTRYSAYTSPVGRAPFTTAPTPMISGVARAQMTLAVTTTGWEPTSTSVKIRWQRNLAGVWKDITGATSTSYNPTASDIGRALRARCDRLPLRLHHHHELLQPHRPGDPRHRPHHPDTHRANAHR